MFDTHSHLYFPDFDADRQDVIERAQKMGVSFFLQAGASLKDSVKAVDLANKYDNMIASVGIHPHEAQRYADESKNDLLNKDLNKLKDCANKYKIVRGIGECGLDFGKTGKVTKNILDAQIKLFTEQIALANHLNLPLIIHSRNSHHEIANILKNNNCVAPAIIHCFTGNWEQAKAYLELGCYISFSGIITFNKNVHPIQEAAIKMPLDKMLVETDAPYLAPEPFRGTRNEPAYVFRVIETIAMLRGKKMEEIEDITDQNARTVFQIAN